MNNKIIIIFASIIIFGGSLLYQTYSPRTAPPHTQSEIIQTAAQEVTNFTTLTSAQLVTMLQRKDFFFVNVHTPYEGEIKDTDAFIPYDKIADNFDKLPADKNTKIVLYCRSGRMSEIVARELVNRGYTQVSHLSGGMIDWEKNGYKIVERNK